MVVEGWRQRGHNEGTSLRADARYDEKCRDEKTQVRNVAEDLPQGRGCPALFHPELTREAWMATAVPCPCQNGRKTAVNSGRSRAPRTASDLGTYRLTRCVKRPS